MGINRIGGNGLTEITQAAGTKIRVVAQPYPNGMTTLTKWIYKTGGTQHVITTMRPIGKTQVAASVAAAGTSITLATDPGPTGNLLAVGDILVIFETDNIARVYVISAWNAGTKVATIPAMAAGVNAGGYVWNMGIETDTDPAIGLAHPKVTVPLSSTVTRENDAGMISGHEAFCPVLVSADNSTNAGQFDQIDWMYHAAPFTSSFGF